MNTGTRTAIEHLQEAQRQILEAGERIERELWSHRVKIETALRPVRDYLEHQPIEQVAGALSALLQVERLIGELPPHPFADELEPGRRRRRRLSSGDKKT